MRLVHVSYLFVFIASVAAINQSMKTRVRIKSQSKSDSAWGQISSSIRFHVSRVSVSKPACASVKPKALSFHEIDTRESNIWNRYQLLKIRNRFQRERYVFGFRSKRLEIGLTLFWAESGTRLASPLSDQLQLTETETTLF